MPNNAEVHKQNNYSERTLINQIIKNQDLGVTLDLDLMNK